MQSVAAITVTDDFHNKIILPAPAQRIIILAPHFRATLTQLGSTSKINGELNTAAYTPTVSIGNMGGLDLEKILRLKPDLILAWGNLFIKQLSFLQQHGIAVYYANPTSLLNISKNHVDIGRLVGKCSLAKQQARQFLTDLSSLKRTFQQRKKLSVFFQISDHPMYTVNADTWINDAIQLCNATNIFAKAQFSSFPTTYESVIALKPDIIIGEINAENRSIWHQITSIGTMQHLAIYTLAGDSLAQPSLTILSDIKKLCETIHQKF